MTQVEINRINELARLSRVRALTETEKEEQAKLRRAYIDSIVGSVKAQLDVTYIIDEQGNRRKVKQKQS